MATVAAQVTGVALTQSLAQEILYAMGVAIKKGVGWVGKESGLCPLRGWARKAGLQRGRVQRFS